MASERRTCPDCHRKFSRPLGSRRIGCETCRPPRPKKKAPPPVDVPSGPHGGTGDLERAAVAALTLAGRLESFEGQLWLRLAREADAAPGPKVAALVGGLLKAKGEALAGWRPPRNDRIDELTRARERKAAGA